MKILLPFLILPVSLFPQADKGIKPAVASESSNPQVETRAVVLGISDYQSPDIPDLNYAGRDAEEFAAWLKSPSGGGVPDGHILLLTDGAATFAAFADALDWLLESCKEGDQAIIYFSGHGDIETKTYNQLGFLLLHDSPARCYKAGAYSLVYFQDVISTLSTQNKVRVTVITDACHAGKLAGTNFGGSGATVQNLAQQFANEVKILSCQPNEFSLEGKQWGGGRGVFSWHLIDGLTGLADQNADGEVNLKEIRRYLEDLVPAETAPQIQTPFTVGDPQTMVVRVDPEALARLQKEKEEQRPVLLSISMKGLEDAFLGGGDAEAGRMCLQQDDPEKAESWLQYALSIDPTFNPIWIQINAHLGEVKRRQGRFAEADVFFQKAVESEKSWDCFPFLEEAHFLYGSFLLSQKREAEARAQFEKCMEYRPYGWRQAYGMALLAAYDGKKHEALNWIEQSLDHYLPSQKLIEEEPLFGKLRHMERFKELMVKYFPK